MKLTTLIAGAALSLATAQAATASVYVLNFAGLNGNAEEYVDNYYNGGTGSLGSGPGPNYGISFSSNALALKGWSDVATLMPGQMAGKSRKVEMANVNGKTFYRGFVGGFASKNAAQAFCASLTAAGKGCIVR